MKLRKFLNEFHQKPEQTRTFSSSENLLSDKLRVEMIGQNVERSYNDRDVYIKIELSMTEIQTWIKGEEAIQLGEQLIQAGNDALEFNRKNAYEIIEILAALNGVKNGKYSRLIITKKSNERPFNYGPGFYYYDLLYVSNNSEESRLIKDVVIYWSPFVDEFDKQMLYYSGGLPVDTIDWSYEEIKRDFDKDMEKITNSEIGQGE